MAGIPVFSGFFAKLAVIQAILDHDGFVWLAVVAVMFSLVGAFYYLRVVKLMFMDEPSDNSAIVVNGDMRLMLSLNCLAVLALGLAPQWLLNLCASAVQHSLVPM
jgi:NADH-quinone oxidoreductase subunit N